jgi:hypothetical protein
MMNYPEIIKDIFNGQDASLFGACAILSPPITNFVKDAGYNTVGAFTNWPMQVPEGQQSHFRNANQINIIVTGGSNNNYCSIGGLANRQSVKLDNSASLDYHAQLFA